MVKISRYIEIKDKEDWKFTDWVEFIFETSYITFLPFFIGYLIAITKISFLALLLFFPIHLQWDFRKKGKNKRIYIK